MLKIPSILFSHRPSNKDNIPLWLPNLTINNHKIKQEESIKYGVAHISQTWKNFIVHEICIYIIRTNSNIQGTFLDKKILNIYQLNIVNNVMFTPKISTRTLSSVFHPRFQIPCHFYPILLIFQCLITRYMPSSGITF